MDRQKEIVLITGTDSGIGRSLAKEFLKRGYTVLAAYLKKTDLKGSINIKLDIRREKDIKNVERKVKQLTKKGYILRCLINNAGVAFGGPIENLPMKIYRENFEVNYFGLVSLTQKMIPYLIKSKGRIMIIGSAAGKTALPFLSPYVSTKFAIEGFSDSLRREMLPFGVKTILIEPGAVATPIWNKAKRQDTSFVNKKYKKSLGLFKSKFIEGGNEGISSDLAARKIVIAFKHEDPKARYVVARSSLQEYLPRLIPSKIMDWIFLKAFKMDYGKK